MSEQESMKKEDLFLLLKSYENTIQLNTTLLEQQKKLLEQQNEILKQQSGTNNSIVKVLEKLAVCSTDFASGINGIKLRQSDQKANCGLGHSKITNKVYIGWVGMGIIIISLLGIFGSTLTQLWEHNSLIKAIAINLGVPLI